MLKATSERTRMEGRAPVPEEQLPAEVKDTLTKRLDFEDNNFLSRMSGDF